MSDTRESPVLRGFAPECLRHRSEMSLATRSPCPAPARNRAFSLPCRAFCCSARTCRLLAPPMQMKPVPVSTRAPAPNATAAVRARFSLGRRNSATKSGRIASQLPVRSRRSLPR
ncbi:hypothetical protein WQQ_44120 [Hydrocarboniphaga effusa AP103]|uniref:Uncharacterized protein n=1 Tax=Hydrocarboniphaga effusa AP103 TaxID=1172194 RepID=I7Z8L7_9GAMM|nr:hypothetical protein WQQ_44120 [Hydrocarboniphaga effusa AP103]